MAAQQVYTTGNVTTGTNYAPALIAVWVTTAGNMTVIGKGDAAASATIAVAVGLMNFPYPVTQIATATAVFGVGVQAG